MNLFLNLYKIKLNSTIKDLYSRSGLNRNITTTCKNRGSNNLNVKTNVIKDVILFKYENPRFFKVLNICAVCQFGFWSYLSLFSFKNLRDAPVVVNDAPWWQRINLGDSKYRNTIAICSFIIGYGFLTLSWMYTLRSVRYLILRKGGESVTFVTYTPFGQNRMMTVPLNKVSCQDIRTVSRAHLPIKVKQRFMYYLLDSKGEFKNASLFDHTAGLKRNLK